MYGADGTVTYAASYDPYGTPFEQFGLNHTDFGFTGEQTDENGLQYLRARYYNPTTGTFLSHDPIWGIPGSSQSYNGYSYAQGNPINWSDPTGMYCQGENLTEMLSCGVSNAIELGSTLGAVASYVLSGKYANEPKVKAVTHAELFRNVQTWWNAVGKRQVVAAFFPEAFSLYRLDDYAHGAQPEWADLLVFAPLVPHAISGAKNAYNFIADEVQYSRGVGGGLIGPSEANFAAAKEMVDARRLQAEAEGWADATMSLDENPLRSGKGIKNTNPRIIGELPEGDVRTPDENELARQYFKNNKLLARTMWEELTGQTWPVDKEGNPVRAEHVRSIKYGGHPLMVEPGFGDSNAPHSVVGEDGLTDAQRFGRLGTIQRMINQANRNKGGT